MIERPDRLVLTGKKTVMSIQREPTFIAAAPALLLYCGDAHKASKVGTILFYHTVIASSRSSGPYRRMEVLEPAITGGMTDERRRDCTDLCGH